MKKRFLINLFLPFLSILISADAYAVMPEWAFFRDRDGNRYYFDRQGGIHVPASPGKSSTPVNPGSIDYHINHGIELIRSGHRIEGLTVLRSIIAMPDSDERVLRARKRAVKALARLEKREGPRYTELYMAASPLLYRTGTGVNVVNEEMRYSLEVPFNTVLLKKKVRRKGRYIYFGITLGSGKAGAKTGDEGTGAWSFLIAVDSEKFPADIRGLERAEKNWWHKTGYADVDRFPVSRETGHAIYEFKSRQAPFYSGIEGIYVNGSITLMVRLITPSESYSRNRSVMRDIINKIVIVD